MRADGRRHHALHRSGRGRRRRAGGRQLRDGRQDVLLSADRTGSGQRWRAVRAHAGRRCRCAGIRTPRVAVVDARIVVRDGNAARADRRADHALVAPWRDHVRRVWWLALVVAAIGLYSVVSYNVAQRTHELGVRVAFGARVSHVLRLVLGEGLRLAIAGMMIGAAIALYAGRWIEPLLFRVGGRSGGLWHRDRRPPGRRDHGVSGPGPARRARGR